MSNCKSFSCQEKHKTQKETIRVLQAEIGRLKGERDEWKSSSALYEKSAQEATRGLECLSEIDDAWDVIGTRGNKSALSLPEQIFSLMRELDDAEASALRKRVEELEKALRPFARRAFLYDGMDGDFFCQPSTQVKDLRRARTLTEGGNNQ